MMQVSHETIYQSLFVQGRGELRRELARCLRSGRTARRHQGRVEKRGKNPNMVMISERPAEIEDRAVPGHWEGDLIIGAGGKSAVGTLVERSTRFVLLLHLPEDHGAQSVERAMRKAIRKLPDELARSITWDQGREMASHVDFTVATGIPIYFCDPHSPWQRGIKREHQRTFAPIHAQEHRPLPAQCSRSGPNPTKPQRPSSQDAWIHETIREVRRARCAHRLKSPAVILVAA